jgi:hypothetical protein
MLANDSPQHTNVFISYAREDDDFVRVLEVGLKDLGVEAKGDWLLEPGPDYTSQLHTLILTCDAFIFILSPASVASRSCVWEIGEAGKYNKRILPVLRRDNYDEANLHSALRLPQWTLMREQDDFTAKLRLLLDAINTDFKLMQEHTRLLIDAEDWSQDKGNRSTLLRGASLNSAEIWLERANALPSALPKPTPPQNEYLAASRIGARRRFMYLSGIAALSIIAITIAGAVIHSSRAQAESRRLVAESRQVASNAISFLQTEPEQSLKLAVKAAEISPTYEAISALRQALQASHVRTVLCGHKDAIVRARFSPDGKLVAS